MSTTLSTPHVLQVRQDSSEGFYVEGLTQKDVQTSNRALRLMSDALMYRHTRAHRLNSHSSRSHCLITFTIASQELGSNSGAQGGVRRWVETVNTGLLHCGMFAVVWACIKMAIEK